MRLPFVRQISSALFVWCALLFGLMPAPAHAVDMDVLIGFGQSITSGARYRPDSWTPLTVYLTGTGIGGNAQLQITLNNFGHVTTYTRRILLHDGAINQTEGFALNLHDMERYGQVMVREVEVQLLAEGRKLASKKMALPAPIDSSAYTVLAMTRDSSGLNFLTKKKLGLIHRHTNPAALANMRGSFGGDPSDSRGINPNATLQLLYTDVRALPSMPQGYEAIDALALADQPIDSLTDAQTAAIKTFVRQGGLLIVSGGGDLSRLRSQFFAELLPLVPSGVISVPSLPMLETRYKAPLSLNAPTALTTGTLVPGASVLLAGTNASTPLVTSRPYGAGRVVFTGFDYVDPAFRGWNGAAALWRDLLRTGNEAISPRNLLDAATFSESGQRMVDALAGQQASSFPNWIVLTAFLLAYILLLLPVNYFILKRLDRRELGWISIPILIVAFVIASYLIAMSIKGGALSANRAVIVETQANTPQAAGYGQMTLYSPRRATYDISLASTENVDAQSFALRDALGNEGGSIHDLTVDSTIGSIMARDAQIRLWDKRTFDSPLNITIGDGIEAQTRVLSDHTVEVIVSNKTPFALRHCALISEEQHVDIEDLAPGQSSSPKTIKWGVNPHANNIALGTLPDNLPLITASSASGNGIKNYSNDSSDEINQKRPGAPTHDKIVMAIGDALARGSEANYGYGETSLGYGRSINAFVGWFDAPLMSPLVDGKPAPRGEEVNLLVAHLPAPERAVLAISALANPFAQKPILNLENELPPGARKAGSR